MNPLFCDRISPRQALRVRSATQVILTPPPRSQLSYKGQTLALHTTIFGSGYGGFGQELPQLARTTVPVGQNGRKEQPSIVDQAVVVEGYLDAVGVLKW